MSNKRSAYPQIGHRGTGRRKEAIARVRIKPGSGKVFVNGELADDYFQHRSLLVQSATKPLVTVGLEDDFDVLCKVVSGGKSGQADAIKLGLARALVELNPEYDKTLRDEGFLTRDARAKERKKYGQKRARKRFQFSKR